jgi:hypothetical protein
MKKLLWPGIAFVLLLCLPGCTKRQEFLSTVSTAASTTITTTASPAVYWGYGLDCARRNRAMNTYRQAEVDGSNIFPSCDGSSVTGYYDNSNKLRIMEVIIYKSRGKSILRFYPFEQAVAIIGQEIIYATDAPLNEVTEDDMYLDAVSQLVIKDGKVYYYLEAFQPMLLLNSTDYAELYEKAVAALE